MNGTELLGFSVLGTAVLVHIIIVNITIGTGWISAVARFLGWRRQDPALESMGRKTFKILIVHELFSGVWGTIITIVLVGFFPTLAATVTDILFYPLLISLSSIIVRIPSIALFWYTWGKVRPSIHSAIGFVMALSGFAIPFGFRFIFAEITYPYAIGMALQGARDAALTAVFSNPLYVPLILHTWAGALSIGGFVVASFFAIRGNVDVKSAWTGLWHGVLFLGAQGAMGPFYLLSLASLAPLLYSNVLGLASASFDVLPLFVLKISMVAVLAATSILVWRRVKRGSGSVPRFALLLGPLAMAVAVAGEFINDGGRYPYMLLLGTGGLPPADFMNVYTSLSPEVIYGVLAVLFLFVGMFVAVVYYALNKRFLSSSPAV
ncbi:MAG TPA: cytochrome ubiquinol oxidase subunit I [Conexivisphaerales archaeon]|nr:cytochrome ubiquinol oxidase subunit I [Conexivisphaerales archaeon]